MRRVVPVVAAVALAACGKSHQPASDTQVAATVNKGEVSVHQINLLLQQSRVRPEQADGASRALLDRLIDQELMVQKAEDLKLDREPRIMQMMDGARREVLARAYAEHTAEGSAHVTAADIRAYYDAKPELFTKRRVYSLNELQVQAKPDQIGPLRDRVKTAKSLAELTSFVKEQGFPVRVTQSTAAAEALPSNLIGPLDQLKDGQAVLLPDPAGARLLIKISSREEPLSYEQAQAPIEAVLNAERRRKAVEDDVKAMRASATVHKLGRFAQAASAPETGVVGAAQPAASAAPENGGAGGTEISSQSIDKGLAGLK